MNDTGLKCGAAFGIISETSAKRIFFGKEGERVSEIKFCAFADLHYRPGVFFTEGEKRLDAIIRRASESGADFIIHLGDLCHAPHEQARLIKRYESAPMPAYHCLGNHEFEESTYEQVLEAYKLERGYYFFDRGGFRFIVLDLNYARVDGRAVHYSLGNSVTLPDGADKVTLEEGQREWLIETVTASPYPCVLFSHFSLERENSRISDAERASIWETLGELNRGRRRMILAINGHHHMDNLRVAQGIAFLDLNSASYHWINEEHKLFPKELYDEYRLVGHTLIYEDPLSAVITLRDDGYIKIEGVKSRFLYGVDREKVGLPLCDSAGRACTAQILSAELCAEQRAGFSQKRR